MPVRPDGVPEPRTTPQDFREQLEALLEIWDDSRNPDEHRTYIPNALNDEFEHARSLLAHGVMGTQGDKP